MKYLDENGLSHLWAKIKAQSELTEEQLNEIVDKVVEAQKMEIVDSIDKMTDTTKKYVLSTDGHIYEHKTVTETKIPKNQIKYSKNADGTPYIGDNGEKGYKPGYRIKSTGVEDPISSYACIGFIECLPTDIIRTKNMTFDLSSSNCNLQGYGSSHEILTIHSISSSTPLPQIVNENGDIEGTLEQTISSATKEDMKTKLYQVKYLRLTAKKFSITDNDNYNENDPIITINEPTEPYTETKTGWFDTGLSYVPEDYGEEIEQIKQNVTEIEGDIDSLETRVATLENTSSGGNNTGVESYVVEEAERVAKQVYSHQNANTFTFFAISDAHYLPGHENIMKSNIHAGQGMDLIRKNVNVDFAVCLGDNGWGSGVATSENRATIEKGIEEIRSCNACIESAFRGIPNFRSVGNHDSLIYNYTFNNNDYLDASDLFPLYGAYNKGAIFQEGEKQRGYCYRDFEDWKLRVICMNTSDIQDLTPADDTYPIYVSGTQTKWFAETLDMSNKENASDWSILILSHAPIDYGSRCNFLCNIVEAYVSGSAIKDGEKSYLEIDGIKIEYNYEGKNSATIIGNIHGHNHCFLVDYLRRLNTDKKTTTPLSVKKICIPNACFERSNERGENGEPDAWDIEYGEETSYEKVAGTEKDTSICVVTIDPVAKKIYADCYGAGYDRELSY